MVDVIYIATLIAFFALMVAFIHWCEHIIGKDEGARLPFDGIEADADDEGVAATSEKEEVLA